MKKSIRYALRITVGISIFFILLLIVIYSVLTFKKERINDLAIKQINKQVRGQVTIGDLSPDFFRTFPNISVRLTDVTIRDSLWDAHHHDFLQAGKIYLRLGFFSLLSGKPTINKVIVHQGTIYLYTDECGYCNLHRTNDLSPNRQQRDIPEIRFVKSRMIIENESFNSFHDFEADYLDCKIFEKDTSLVLKIAMNSLVHSLTFNLEKGSYLKEKTIEGAFYLLLNPGKKIALNNVNLKIDKQPFSLNGAVLLDCTPLAYDLKIQTGNILYQKAVSLLTNSLQQNFDSINVNQAFDVTATVSGKMAPKVVPGITTNYSMKDIDIETPLGRFSQCTFTGSFTNLVDSLSLPGDENSKLIINNAHGKWVNIPITSTRIEISNLKNPYLISDFQSRFALEDLNSLTESSTIRFLKGKGNLNVTYSGPMAGNGPSHSSLNGTLLLTDAEIHYIPRNLIFKNCQGDLEFRQEDLVINQLVATTGTTNLTMSGNVTNLLALLNINPEKLTMVWDVSTPDLNLQDFVSYVAAKTDTTLQKKSPKNKAAKTSENIDRLLSNGIAKINLTAGKISYKKFNATDVTGSILLLENKVLLNKVRLHHANGIVLLNGSLTHENHSNFFTMESSIKKVDIPGIFRAFDNFGQDAITARNMKGQLSAKIKVSGALTDKAEVVENSMKGTTNFTVKNGELIRFEPAIKIAAIAFKKRDFSQIQFGELHNRLEIDGPAITFHKMEIRSNVVTLFVEGIYDTKKGTDMSIQIPVSNLSMAENEDLKNTGRAGLNIRLRAKTGDDGKLKVSWDPFNNATRQRKDDNKQDTTQRLQTGKQKE